MPYQTAEQAYEAAVDHEFDAAAEAATLIDAFDIDAAIDKQLASMERGNQLGKLQEAED